MTPLPLSLGCPCQAGWKLQVARVLGGPGAKKHHSGSLGDPEITLSPRARGEGGDEITLFSWLPLLEGEWSLPSPTSSGLQQVGTP